MGDGRAVLGGDIQVEKEWWAGGVKHAKNPR